MNLRRGANGNLEERNLRTEVEDDLSWRIPELLFGFLDLDDGADDLRGKPSLRLGEGVDAEVEERFRDVAQPVEGAHVHHALSDEQASAFDEHSLAAVAQFDGPQDLGVVTGLARGLERLVVITVWTWHPAGELGSDEIRKKDHWAAPGVLFAGRECKHFEYSKRKREIK